jgi:hypothetical protein
LEKKSLLSCDSVADERDIGEGSLVMVEISEEEAYVVTEVVLAAVMLAAVVLAAVVAAAGVESRFVAGVEEDRDASKSMCKGIRPCMAS